MVRFGGRETQQWCDRVDGAAGVFGDDLVNAVFVAQGAERRPSLGESAMAAVRSIPRRSAVEGLLS
jgi:hypothetical protein